MFDNVSGKLKVFAKVLFWCGVIASIVWAIVLWGTTEHVRYEKVHPYVSTGFGVLFGGVAGSYLSSLLLYAIGECIDHLAHQIKQNESIIQLLKGEPQSAPTTAPAADSTNGWVCRLCGRHNSLGAMACIHCGAVRSQNPIDDSGKWECPSCGKINKATAQHCYGCFTKKPQ